MCWEEVKKMERKMTLLVPVLVLLVLSAVEPALAATAEKVPVNAIASIQITSLGTYWITDGGILQMREGEALGTIKLYITSTNPAQPDYTPAAQ
jgi:uncharacterized membrane protein